MFCPHKNSYLQLVTEKCNPRAINRAVSEAMNAPTDTFDIEPPFYRLTSSQPNIPIANFDVTRRPLAFGRWALPKLRKELHNDCPEIVLQALNSILDLSHDPEKTFEMVGLRMVDRLSDIMNNKNPVFRERVCMILMVLATQELGRTAICECESVLFNLLTLIDDEEPCVRIKTASVIRNITNSWMACDILVKYNFINGIVDLIIKEESNILNIHLESLKNLMYGEGKEIAFTLGTFDALIVIIDRADEFVITKALQCMSVLATLSHVKKFSVQISLLKKIYLLLLNDKESIHTAAAELLMFLTHRTKAKKQSRLIPGLIGRLITLAKNFHYPRVQLYALRTLTNLTEHPETRQEMISKYLQEIEDIIVVVQEPMPAKEVQSAKETLLRVIKWKP